MFFDADGETVFEVHCVPVGMDAKTYAGDWIKREQRLGNPSRPYLIERDVSEGSLAREAASW
jgi:hypothetical protein